MAKIIAFTDRHPNDNDWKGAFTWNLIRSLAESQHQVLALTTLDPQSIPVQHPRLSVARPASSWRADQLPRFLRVLMSFRPEVIHTFALKPSKLWPALTIWPYLQNTGLMLPEMRRFSTLFEPDDLREKEASLAWHRGSQICVVFTGEQSRLLSDRFGLQATMGPLELDAPKALSPSSDVILPAPASEWPDLERGLRAILEFLRQHSDLKMKIIGGWGNLPASQRRAAWATLIPVAERVFLEPLLSYEEFKEEAGKAQGLWLECLKSDSWRYVLSARLAENLGSKVFGAMPELQNGSAANYLSRLYAYS